jgi:hypothetical protein
VRRVLFGGEELRLVDLGEELCLVDLAVVLVAHHQGGVVAHPVATVHRLLSVFLATAVPKNYLHVRGDAD